MYNNLFSQNTTFNFIIKERGSGKAYGILKKIVKNKTKDLTKYKNFTQDGGTPHVL